MINVKLVTIMNLIVLFVLENTEQLLIAIVKVVLMNLIINQIV